MKTKVPRAHECQEVALSFMALNTMEIRSHSSLVHFPSIDLNPELQVCMSISYEHKLTHWSGNPRCMLQHM